MRQHLLTSLVLVATLTATLSSDAFSQMRQRERLSPEEMKERIDRRLEELDEALELTDEQKTQLESLFNQDLPREPAPQGQSRSERLNAFRSMRQRRTGREEDIKKILTPEQYEKYNNLQKKQRIDMRFDRLDEQLTLTEAQKTVIRGILERNDEMMRELMGKDYEDRRERFEAMRTLREKTDKAIEEELTESQKKEYQDMLEQQRSRMRRRME